MDTIFTNDQSTDVLISTVSTSFIYIKLHALKIVSPIIPSIMLRLC